MSANPVLAPTGRLSPEAAGARLHELFTEHGRMVYGVCRLVLRDPHEAEDAAQETFLSAHRSILAGTEPHDPAAWLATIARNECRSRVRDRMRELLPLVQGLEPTAEGPEQVADRNEEIDALRRALRELPESQREAVVLRDFYGLRYDEVGAALGVSESAVESLIFRARRRLQERLRSLRVAAGGLLLPAALREALAGNAPGLASASAGAGGGAGVAAVIAKIGSAPLAAKLAAATVAVTAAGTVGVVEYGDERPPRSQRAVPAVALSSAVSELGVAGSTGASELEPDPAAGRDERGDEDGHGGGPGPSETSDERDEDQAGRSGGEESGKDDGRVEEGSSSGPSFSSGGPDGGEDERVGESTVSGGEDSSGSSEQSSGGAEDSGEGESSGSGGSSSSGSSGPSDSGSDSSGSTGSSDGGSSDSGEDSSD